MSLASTIEVEIELPKPRMGIEDVAHIINDSSNERVPVKLLDEKEELLETPSQAIHFLRKSIASKLMTKMGPIAAELPTWDLLAEISDMIMKPKKNETEEHAIDQAIKYATNEEKHREWSNTAKSYRLKAENNRKLRVALPSIRQLDKSVKDSMKMTLGDSLRQTWEAVENELVDKIAPAAIVFKNFFIRLTLQLKSEPTGPGYKSLEEMLQELNVEPGLNGFVMYQRKFKELLESHESITDDKLSDIRIFKMMKGAFDRSNARKTRDPETKEFINKLLHKDFDMLEKHSRAPNMEFKTYAEREIMLQTNPATYPPKPWSLKRVWKTWLIHEQHNTNLGVGKGKANKVISGVEQQQKKQLKAKDRIISNLKSRLKEKKTITFCRSRVQHDETKCPHAHPSEEELKSALKSVQKRKEYKKKLDAKRKADEQHSGGKQKKAKSETACKFYFAKPNRCTRGNNCEFSHDETSNQRINKKASQASIVVSDDDDLDLHADEQEVMDLFKPTANAVMLAKADEASSNEENDSSSDSEDPDINEAIDIEMKKQIDDCRVAKIFDDLVETMQRKSDSVPLDSLKTFQTYILRNNQYPIKYTQEIVDLYNAAKPMARKIALWSVTLIFNDAGTKVVTNTNMLQKAPPPPGQKRSKHYHLLDILQAFEKTMCIPFDPQKKRMFQDGELSSNKAKYDLRDIQMTVWQKETKSALQQVLELEDLNKMLKDECYTKIPIDGYITKVELKMTDNSCEHDESVHKNKNRGKQVRTSATPHIEFDFEKSKPDRAYNPANRVKNKVATARVKKLHRNVNSALKNVAKEIEIILGVNAVCQCCGLNLGCSNHAMPEKALRGGHAIAESAANRCTDRERLAAPPCTRTSRASAARSTRPLIRRSKTGPPLGLMKQAWTKRRLPVASLI